MNFETEIQELPSALQDASEFEPPAKPAGDDAVEAAHKAAEEKEKAKKARAASDDITDVGGEGVVEDDDDEEDESNLSLAAMEALVSSRIMMRVLVSPK